MENPIKMDDLGVPLNLYCIVFQKMIGEENWKSMAVFHLF